MIKGSLEIWSREKFFKRLSNILLFPIRYIFYGKAWL